MGVKEGPEAGPERAGQEKMSKMDIMFMSKSNEWATPQDFFDELNKEFNFNLDPCSDDTNYKCEKHYTQADDGLSQDWGGVQSLLQSSIWPGN